MCSAEESLDLIGQAITLTEKVMAQLESPTPRAAIYNRCLEALGARHAQGRRVGLEEAAKRCEFVMKDFDETPGDSTAEICAADIRALIDNPKVSKE